ncbi:MAG: MFS transporter [Ilumatobacteraceae bacterium]
MHDCWSCRGESVASSTVPWPSPCRRTSSCSAGRGRIGVVVTGMLLGSAALTLLVGVRLGGVPRRTILRWGAVTMVVCGLVCASTTVFVVLLVVGVIGTMNPSSGDVSVFSPVEQSLVPSTVADADRTRLFARYTFTGTLAAALGSLVVGVPEWVADRTSIGETAALRSVFGAYALAGVVVWVVFRRLSPAVEPRDGAAHPLGPSRPMVHRLALVFAVDSFGGGFVVQSLLALWLFRHFDLSTGAARLAVLDGSVLGGVDVRLAAPRCADRAGAHDGLHPHARTGVPDPGCGGAEPAARRGVPHAAQPAAAMDVPARNSYVMAVVTPAERAAAASVTQVPRSLAAAVPPLFAGWLLDQSSFGWPLVIGGVLKLVYDVTLLSMFRHVRPPEEAGSLSR